MRSALKSAVDAPNHDQIMVSEREDKQFAEDVAKFNPANDGVEDSEEEEDTGMGESLRDFKNPSVCITE
ncbi:hypothetical protein QJS04_geneDACA017877 [Acorus gramineus]|uniref:Uncharacterized protein n=1 Tax=Acorus gramineus TaxID=55184 RepID=A0AAV9ANA6_ACOGR|nr:hypothetical protein QJS04_geneDACA017877 [Acorus gramineus]